MTASSQMCHIQDKRSMNDDRVLDSFPDPTLPNSQHITYIIQGSSINMVNKVTINIRFVPADSFTYTYENTRQRPLITRTNIKREGTWPEGKFILA